MRRFIGWWLEQGGLLGICLNIFFTIFIVFDVIFFGGWITSPHDDNEEERWYG